ncbi:hypothetical protein ACFX1R_034014 [Malus domestica]
MRDFEIVEAITLGSGLEVGAEPKMSKHSLEVDKELLFEEEEENSAIASLEEALQQHLIIFNPIAAATLAPPSNSSKVLPNSILSNLISPNVPFPCRFMQSKKEESEKDILEGFQKLQVNFPILGTIKKVPECAKYFKELCTTRRRIQEKEVAREYLEFIKDDVVETTIPKEVGFYNTGQVTALIPNLTKSKIPKTFEVVFILEFLSHHTGKPPPQLSISVSTNMLLISIIQAPTQEFKPLPDHFKYHLPFKDQLHAAGPNEG